MDSISFSFLLYEAYCVVLYLVLPIGQSPASTRPWLKPLHRDVVVRTSWSVFLLAAFLFAFIDMVIDPVALRGDRWFLGKIYYYPDLGIHSGVPFANYVGWLSSDSSPSPLIFRSSADSLHSRRLSRSRLDSCRASASLYYGVLVFDLGVTFWIGESFMGMSGRLMHLSVIVLLMVRLAGPRGLSPSG